MYGNGRREGERERDDVFALAVNLWTVKRTVREDTRSIVVGVWSRPVSTKTQKIEKDVELTKRRTKLTPIAAVFSCRSVDMLSVLKLIRVLFAFLLAIKGDLTLEHSVVVCGHGPKVFSMIGRIIKNNNNQKESADDVFCFRTNKMTLFNKTTFFSSNDY